MAFVGRSVQLSAFASRAFSEQSTQRFALRQMATSSKPTRLAGSSLEQALQTVSQWQPSLDQTGKADSISRTFKFTDFKAAWSFMSRIALYAEQKDHHPEWFNVYNRVEIKLTTHDAAGISQRDIDMANAIDSYASSSTDLR